MSDWMTRRAEMTKVVEQHLIRYGGDRFPDYFVERAAGSYVYDDEGRPILDFTSGQMCSTLGHNHPDVVAKVEAYLKGARTESEHWPLRAGKN